ncbi:hypothetical protein CCM_05357 [Cordyceps militaris CM01]|uniref:Uncharacterized protein n=1 Tax=Cordyceps militaris (strain CM01) TaxID=983644 RepID=G3JJA5_CORMM|nr:uncharacterized protein CCM_05357 [Cordyceps militaris CM01]EGX91199.1 hypothetical protein CCM_05357 [Cordyceps militaris CM01]
MDRLDTLLLNARTRLGCSGLRDLADLAQMRQDTLEKRIASAQHLLTVRNTLSIYTAWLWKKTFSIAPKDLQAVMGKWCVYLWGIGCTREMAHLAWTTAQTMLGPPVSQSSPLGELQMGVGFAIAYQFSFLPPPTKRSFAVLADGAGSEEGEVADSQDALSPTAKRRKASHAGQGIPAAPFCQPARRGDVLPVSPRNKAPGSHFVETRQAQEENQTPWTRDGFNFNFRRKCSLAVGKT